MTQPLKELATWLKKQNEHAPHWTFSYRFAELQVAESWHKSPDEWNQLELREKEEMFAFWKSRQEMKNWESHLQQKALQEK